jgi:hypothetical protein
VRSRGGRRPVGRRPPSTSPPSAPKKNRGGGHEAGREGGRERASEGTKRMERRCGEGAPAPASGGRLAEGARRAR